MQWISKLCPFYISKNIFGDRYTLRSGRQTIVPLTSLYSKFERWKKREITMGLNVMLFPSRVAQCVMSL